jgi:hypothetical protein
VLNFELMRVAVANAGGFHRAAERLNLTQSTISQASVRRLANTTSSRPARNCSGPFDGGGGPPSHHKIIPPADIEERQRPAHDKNDNGGDHDRKASRSVAHSAARLDRRSRKAREIRFHLVQDEQDVLRREVQALAE